MAIYFARCFKPLYHLNQQTKALEFPITAKDNGAASAATGDVADGVADDVADDVALEPLPPPLPQKPRKIVTGKQLVEKGL